MFLVAPRLCLLRRLNEFTCRISFNLGYFPQPDLRCYPDHVADKPINCR